KDSDSIFVVMIDMNNLKLINDTLGHKQGDIGICTIAKATERTAHRGEICVRAGGDEFYIVGVGEYKPEDGETRVAEFRENLKTENEISTAEWNYQAAVGFSIVETEAGNALQEAISRADDAMYVDKSKKIKMLSQKVK
ncbi:MAG: GGDEF domain-containing protein, partial [Lachnospiraceae bacterium]|nr:GGDEF domain-containing protein [Lachnospiraceae bacterium]